jgi:hypothetical protein
MSVREHVRIALLCLAVALIAACESQPAFPVPAGPPASVALDVQVAHWTLGRYAIDGFEQALGDQLAKYNIRVVDRRARPTLVARIDLGLPGYRQAIDVELVRSGVRATTDRVLVPDLQETTLDVAAQLVAAVVARAVWTPPAASVPVPGRVSEPSSDGALESLRRDARALEPMAQTSLARAFLSATASQPPVSPRVVWADPATRAVWSDAEASSLTPERRASLTRRELDSSFYWETNYGSPLSYLRAVDVLGGAGLADLAGKRIVDFGYGTVGQLRLMATLGADAVGVDVDPLLAALYSRPEDQGSIGPGHVTLVTGRWPALPSTRAGVGARLDVFLSKNTLKRGYVHPTLAVNPSRHFDLGVDDATFLAAVHDALVPRGLALLYNVCPAPAPDQAPYIPWADGRSPFDRAAWERAGFEVLEMDHDDTPALRAVAHVLRWDSGEDALDIEHDIFATYTLARRR